MLAFSGLFDSFRRGNERRAALRSLSGLSSAQLHDIGIGADQIEEVVDAMLATRREQPAAARQGRPAAAQAALAGCG